MTEERRAALMAYCRMDDLGPGGEELLESFYQAAVNYMTQAGIAEPEIWTPRRAQYDLCVNALVLDSWDRRGTTTSGGGAYTAVENVSFRRTLNQLKLTEPDPYEQTERSD